MDELSKNTINKYIININIINKLLFDEEIKYEKNELEAFIKGEIQLDFNKWFETPEEDVIKIIRNKYSNDNTYIGYLNSYRKVSILSKRELPLIKLEHLNMKKIVDKERNQNILKENNYIINLDDEFINDILINKTDLFGTIKQRLIFALYTLLPSRRLDYRLLKLIKPTTKDELDKEYNYVYITDDKINFIFNEFKTKKYYDKEFSFENNLLISIFNEYIKIYKIKDNSLIFRNKQNKLCSVQTFSLDINEAFYKVYKIGNLNMGDIRNSWANKISRNMSNMSVDELNKITSYMGHSIIQNLKYRKIN